MKLKVGCIVLITGILAACETRQYFAFDDVVQVRDFNIKYFAAIPDTIITDAVALQGIKVFNNCFLVSSAGSTGCITAFDKDGGRISTPFLKIGRGPGEVLYRPFLSWCSFLDASGKACLYDFKGNYVEYDIEESMSGRPFFTYLAESLPVSHGACYFMVGDSLLLCKKSNDSRDGFTRSILDFRGNESALNACKYLDSFSSTESNVLSTLVISNIHRGMVAELCSRLSAVHIYSLDDDLCRTLFSGKKPEDIRVIERLDPEDIRKMYYDAHAYEDFFAGLYLNSRFEDLDKNTFSPPVIHFFGWDGKPLATLSLSVRALFFDIDLDEKYLCVIDADNENILRYDISAFLQALFLEIKSSSAA